MTSSAQPLVHPERGAPKVAVAPTVPPRIVRATLQVGGQALSLHLPRGAHAPLPTVLVFHSAMGRSDSVLESCDRLAEQGFAAVALDFFEGKLAHSVEEGWALRDAANGRRSAVRQSIEQTYVAVQNDPRLASKRRFLLGWSFGGAWATAASGFLPDVQGVVAFYGEAFSDNSPLCDALQAPVLLIGAEADPEPAPALLRSISERLSSRNKSVTLVVLAAGHGFAEHNHPGYDRDAAEAGWAEALRFLRAHAS